MINGGYQLAFNAISSTKSSRRISAVLIVRTLERRVRKQSLSCTIEPTGRDSRVGSLIVYDRTLCLAHIKCLK